VRYKKVRPDPEGFLGLAVSVSLSSVFNLQAIQAIQAAAIQAASKKALAFMKY
jgi:hypothetical protein